MLNSLIYHLCEHFVCLHELRRSYMCELISQRGFRTPATNLQSGKQTGGVLPSHGSSQFCFNRLIIAVKMWREKLPHWCGKGNLLHFFPVINRMRSKYSFGGTQLDKCVGHPTLESQIRLCSVSGHRHLRHGHIDGDVADRMMGKGWEPPAELRAQVGCVIMVRYVSTNTLQHK